MSGSPQELRELDRAYVPEAQLRAMQEEGKRSREELTARLDRCVSHHMQDSHGQILALAFR